MYLISTNHWHIAITSCVSNKCTAPMGWDDKTLFLAADCYLPVGRSSWWTCLQPTRLVCYQLCVKYW